MKNPFHFFSPGRKGAPARTYDPEKEKPVIRASICTGERVAGFRDRRSGTFHDVMLIRNQKDLDEFLRMYGLEEIDTEY